jgi:hypothetical protein
VFLPWKDVALSSRPSAKWSFVNWIDQAVMMKTLSLLLCVALIEGAVAKKTGNSVMYDGNELALRLGPTTFSGNGCSQQDVAVSLSSDESQLEVALNSAFTVRGSAELRHARIACSGVIHMDVPEVRCLSR